jgi:hypothetical protein
MPKLIDYPRSSFTNSLEIAKAVASLGGNCDKATCADQMHLKLSGAFDKRIGTAVKFNLINISKGRLTITDLYKSIKTAYDDAEQRKFEMEAFLTPAVFKSLYSTFKGQKLPVTILGKYLIREYNVDDNIASLVAKYFIEGLKYLQLIEGDVVLNPVEEVEQVEEEIQEDFEEGNVKPFEQVDKNSYLSLDRRPQILHIENNAIQQKIERNQNEYLIHIIGPGMDSEITVKEEDDLLIVNAIIQKIKKKL